MLKLNCKLYLYVDLIVTFCILEVVSPEGNDHLLSSSFVAPFLRQADAEKIIYLVGSEGAWLIAE